MNMTNFKKIIIAGAAILTLGAGTAATAQPWHDGDRNYRESQRDEHLSPDYIKSLDWRIMKQARAGQISWKQAGELRAQERLALKLAWRRERGGHLAPFEYGQLTRAVRTIEVGTSHYADNNDRRGYGDRDHDRYGYRR